MCWTFILKQIQVFLVAYTILTLFAVDYIDFTWKCRTFIDSYLYHFYAECRMFQFRPFLDKNIRRLLTVIYAIVAQKRRMCLTSNQNIFRQQFTPFFGRNIGRLLTVIYAIFTQRIFNSYLLYSYAENQDAFRQEFRSFLNRYV